MAALREYCRKQGTTVLALRLDLDTEGFRCRKWGGTQHCKAGDWLVSNGADTYTIDAQVFARTYRQVGPATFAKTNRVWAEPAKQAGGLRTREGSTDYAAGDMLVFNDAQRRDGYAMSLETFEGLYVRVEG